MLSKIDVGTYTYTYTNTLTLTLTLTLAPKFNICRQIYYKSTSYVPNDTKERNWDCSWVIHSVAIVSVASLASLPRHSIATDWTPLLLSVLPSLFQCYLKSTLALTLAKYHLPLNSTFVDRFIAPTPLTTTKAGSPTFKFSVWASCHHYVL